jgi:ABC-type sulfate/molybdate transport systems ATPase subunit
MTVRQNLAFAAGSAADGPAENIDELLERFRIGHLSGRRPHEISGGERQRCSIARTLASRPRLLLMDEPGQGLDLGLRRELHQILRELRREYPMPMLLVTHDLWEALALADSMLVYAGGRIIQRGSPSEVYRRPDSLRVATLLGVENVFEGRVVSVSGGRMKLAAAGIQAEAAALAGRSAGDLVSFCIGSDAVRAIPCNGSSAAGATTRLLATEDAGDRMRLLFEGGWSAALPRGEFEQYRNAEAWRIQVEDGAVWVFPEN